MEFQRHEYSRRNEYLPLAPQCSTIQFRGLLHDSREHLRLNADDLRHAHGHGQPAVSLAPNLRDKSKPERPKHLNKPRSSGWQQRDNYLLGTPGGEPPTVPTRPTAPVPAGAAGGATPSLVPPPSEDTGLVGNPMPAPNRRAAAPPGPQELPLDRTVSGENLARLFEQYGPSGAYLGAVRQLRRVSLDELSATTRVSRRFL